MKWINWVCVVMLSGGAAYGVMQYGEAWLVMAAVSVLLCVPLILVNIGFTRTGFWFCLILGLIGLPLSLWGFHITGMLIYSVFLLNAYSIKYPAKEIL